MKLVVFDLDGTLLDTLDDIKCALNYALSAYDIPPINREKTRCFVGRGLKNALLSAVNESGKRIEEDDFALMYELMLSHYRAHYADYTKPYEGIYELLKSLNEKGILISIFSNKAESIEFPLVEKTFSGIKFAFVLGQKDGYPLKPNPERLLSQMEEIGIRKEDAIYVGDSEVDNATADNAKMAKINLNYGFRTKEELSKVGIINTVSSVKELKEEIFKKFCQ